KKRLKNPSEHQNPACYKDLGCDLIIKDPSRSKFWAPQEGSYRLSFCPCQSQTAPKGAVLLWRQNWT
ncbi:MAG: hypothetical protein IJJ41_06320, partial [Clostridia bacterium]|nr:hypothetical protein [Clostridia bacterium]